MRGRGRSNDWGFPRWRAYGGAAGAPEAQRRCDRDGCDQPGTCPAPKAPNRPERWWFCEAHAAEYNRQWDYFAALSKEEAAAQAETEQRRAGAYGRARHWDWGEGDGSRSRAELDALRLFDLPPDAGEADIKAAHRRMAKANHPDVNPGNAEAAERFQAAQAAYEVLTRAAAARTARGTGR
ncbi:MAG: J domain-containing protein [Sphingomonadaceae bacterium]